MYTRSKKESPRRERNGLAFHIPLQRGDLSDVGLTAFWVDVAPGSKPRPHEHPSEEVYVITAGSGKMLVGEEEGQVGSCNLIYVPPGAYVRYREHFGRGAHLHLGATPALDAEAAYDSGRLRSEERMRGSRRLAKPGRRLVLG